MSVITEEQKAQIIAEHEAEKKAKSKELEEQRELYKLLLSEVTLENIELLKEASVFLEKVKKRVFSNFEAVIEMKKELYGVKDKQRSHTFTNRNTGESITLGYRVIDNFDDTVHDGIAKIKNWVYALADGNKKAEMESVMDILLKKDKNGNLKASRVLELQQLAEKVNDPDFTDGVKIIKDAWKPIKSSYFIEAYEKDEAGKNVGIPLSISAVPMGENQ